MSTVRGRLKISITATAERESPAARMIGVLLLLIFSGSAFAQTLPPGTATASPASQGSALVQWNLALTGGGPIYQIQVQHCSAGVSACSDPSASPALFQGPVTLTHCDGVPGCPSSAVDFQLTASTTYIDKITLFPTSSNTTGQVTSVLTAPYTTPSFPVPSITSFQAMSGSSVLLTTSEADQYYWDMNVYACPGTGCTDFTLLGQLTSNFDPNTGGPPPPSTLTGSIAGLTPSTTYTVYVTAFDGVNTSAASPTVTLQTPAVDTTPPTAPTNLTATVISPTQVNLSYGASTDDLYLNGYQVDRCTGAGCTNFTNIGGALTLTYNDTGLSPSTTYQYAVFALDGSGNRSALSNIVSVTTLPGAPTTLAASNPASTQVSLSWTPSGNAAGLAGYLIEQCQGAGCGTFAQVAQVTSPSAQITGLTPRTTYQFRVRSIDPAGHDSGYSNVVSVTTLPIAAPTALAASAPSDSQITLSWTASTAPGVTAYLVERCSGSGCPNFVQVGSAPRPPYWDGGLLPQTGYQYRIRAQDASGNLSDYITINATTGALPVPTGLLASAVSTSQINLGWSASPSTEKTTYLIERCSGTGCISFTQIATLVSGTTYSDTGLTSNTTYSYRIRAQDPAGNLTSYTPTASARTLVLAPAASLTATAVSSSQVSLSWGSAGGSATSYLVQRCNGVGCNGFVTIATVQSVSFTDTGLCASTTYVYRVQATDAAGDSSVDSNLASATTTSGSGSGGSGCGSGGNSAGGSGGASTYVYDSNGHLKTVTTNGVTVTYSYDAAGHLVSIQTGN